MIRVKCPICGKSFEIAKLDELPSFPFCTDRCRLVDLGRWIDGAYAIPVDSKSEPANTKEDEIVEDEED
jgi:endogenous inhibitor of DNA gyrase (YacG/DUF329 family)